MQMAIDVINLLHLLIHHHPRTSSPLAQGKKQLGAKVMAVMRSEKFSKELFATLYVIWNVLIVIF